MLELSLSQSLDLLHHSPFRQHLRSHEIWVGRDAEWQVSSNLVHIRYRLEDLLLVGTSFRLRADAPIFCTENCVGPHISIPAQELVFFVVP